MKGLLRRFIDINRSVCRWFDRVFLPKSYRQDGNQAFIRIIVPSHIPPGAKIYDVGGGKQPYLDVGQKQKLNAYVVGIDISAQELEAAPPGAYDERLCADITRLQGGGDGDIVICQAVLEHVRDTEGAMSSIASLLKPGGKALIFVPSRNAVYARLNLALPESGKRSILWTLYPSTRKGQGFRSYYHKCTPNDLVRLAAENHMILVQAHFYFLSSYFSFFFPAYLLWRMWIVLFRLIAGNQAAETFTLVLEKRVATCRI
jgi:2-polyprenyl-6-hydroxyphenyl methylase/3-demethylubiquinone-9 3-methyltransferase